MFQRILIPLDGSLLAERALPLAARIARASQGMLIILHVGSGGGGEQGSDALPQSTLGEALIRTRMKRAQEYLAALASSPVCSGIPLTTAVLSGPVVATIQSALDAYQADLLVLCEQIGPQGHSFGIGGIARHLLEQMDRPVLLVPEHGPSPFTEHRSITVLAAFDGPRPAHALAERAIALFTALDEKCQGHLRFVPLGATTTTGLPAEEPVVSVQTIEPPDSSRACDVGQTHTSPGVLNHPPRNAQQKRTDGSDGIVLVLEIPTKAALSTWSSEYCHQPVLLERTEPVLLVPLLARG